MAPGLLQWGGRDDSGATSSQTLFSTDTDVDSFEGLDNMEMEDLSNSRLMSKSPPIEDMLIFEENWLLLSKREKWSLFWRRLWYGPLHPEDLPPQFTNRYLVLLDTLPYRVKKAVPYKLRVVLTLGYLLLWYVIMYSLLAPSLLLPPTHKYTDENGEERVSNVVSLSCNDEPSFWKGKNAACGINGEKCMPFEDREVIFRCPALCDRSSWTYSSIPIGDQQIKYRGYFVGGGKLDKNEDDQLTYPYRSDSFPCGAAIHAGILSPIMGGCAKVSYIGSQPRFPSTKGHYGVDDSVEFDSFFPSSYVFTKLSGISNGHDPRIIVTFVNILFGFPVMYLLKGFYAFCIICTVGFWTICLALDPPIIINVLDPESLPTLISLGLERFLPTIFILYTLWHFAIGNTLKDPEDPKVRSSPISKTLLWYPLFWVGVLNNVTFDRLPVDRLTIEDIKAQPGSLTAILSIVGTIVVCAFIQAYKLWKSGKFKVYLCIYLTFIFSLVVLANMKGLTLRIHHYILAMLLIPGTGTKGLSAMLFQGLLVGLFLSGTARWGLASIAETTRALRRSDPSGAVKPPIFSLFDNSTNILSWLDQDKNLPNVIDGEIQHPSDALDGYSLLINDIEWYKGNETSIDLNQLITDNDLLNKMVTESLSTSENITLYMRLSKASLSTSKHSDYSKAAVLQWPGGELIKPGNGVT